MSVNVCGIETPSLSTFSLTKIKRDFNKKLSEKDNIIVLKKGGKNMVIELFFIALFIFYGTRGYRKGVMLQLVWLLALVCFILFANSFTGYINHLFIIMNVQTDSFLFSPWIKIIIGYFLIYIIFKLILLATKDLKIPGISLLNRVLGACLGVLKASLFCVFIGKLLITIWPNMSPVFEQNSVYMVSADFWTAIFTSVIQGLFVS